MSYFVRFLEHAPVGLRIVVCAEFCADPSSFLASVVSDLEWVQMSGVSAVLQSLPAPTANSNVWYNFILSDPCRFISICRCACMLDTKLRVLEEGYIDSICKKSKSVVSVMKVSCPVCSMCF